MKKFKTTCLILLLALTPVCLWAQQADHIGIRKQAQKAFQDGNWKEAYQLYRNLCLEVTNESNIVGNDLLQAWHCLRNLNRLSEFDGFRQDVIAVHRDNWRLLQAAARSYHQNNHWGYMVAGEFLRGAHRGGGRYVNSIQRDRARAMQPMFSDGAIEQLVRLDVALMNELAASVPGGRHILVEGTGHNVHVDKPEALIAPVVEMIKAVTERKGK